MVIDILNKQDKEELNKQYIDDFFHNTINFYRKSYYIMFGLQFVCGIGLTYFAVSDYYKEHWFSFWFNTIMTLFCFYWMNKINSALKSLDKTNTEYKNLNNNNV